MVFNASFNTISVISWQSVLLVEEAGVPRENHIPVASGFSLSTPISSTKKKTSTFGFNIITVKPS